MEAKTPAPHTSAMSLQDFDRRQPNTSATGRSPAASQPTTRCDSSVVFCQACGKPAKASQRFCVFCGARLAMSAAIEEGPTPPAQAAATPEETATLSAAEKSAPFSVSAPAAFCRACGMPAAQGDEFCRTCNGALGPTSAPFAPPISLKPGVPPSVPPASATAQPRKHRAGLWIGISIATAVVLIMAVILVSGPRPEDSLDRARSAYLQHDQETFDKYVDVSSVLSDWVNQGVNGLLEGNHAGIAQRMIVQSAVQAMKDAYLPAMSQSVDQLVVSGTLAEQPRSGNSDQTNALLAGFISSGLRTLASSQLTYEGIRSRTISGTNALLDVNVRTSLRNRPVVLKIKMHREGDHWRVVAVQDLAGLLEQLDQK